jgi:hypothetical protein
MWAEAGRKACERRRRRRCRLLLLLLGRIGLVLSLLLSQASPQLHTIPAEYNS